MIEGEDPVVADKIGESAVGGRRSGEGRWGGVDQGAQDTGGKGFAATGWSAQKQDGARAGGVEGGEEPFQAELPTLGIGGKAQQRTEVLKSGSVTGPGRIERHGAG